LSSGKKEGRTGGRDLLRGGKGELNIYFCRKGEGENATPWLPRRGGRKGGEQPTGATRGGPKDGEVKLHLGGGRRKKSGSPPINL